MSGTATHVTDVSQAGVRRRGPVWRSLALAGAAAGLLLAGCAGEGAAEADAPVAAPATQAFEPIAWEDLMPDGEQARLEALYAEFYTDFEQRMRAQSQTLAEAGQERDDIASLIPEGGDADTMEQIGTFNVVDALDGKRVRIPGYVVPFDFSADARHDEFLLVPYFGACLHTPPPPPNQMLFVRAQPAARVDDIYEPYWLEGTISTGRFDSELGNSAYELTLSKIEPYAY